MNDIDIAKALQSLFIAAVEREKDTEAQEYIDYLAIAFFGKADIEPILDADRKDRGILL